MRCSVPGLRRACRMPADATCPQCKGAMCGRHSARMPKLESYRINAGSYGRSSISWSFREYCTRCLSRHDAKLARAAQRETESRWNAELAAVREMPA